MFGLAVFAMALCQDHAFADKWPRPEQSAYQSDNERFVFVAVPSNLELRIPDLRLDETGTEAFSRMDNAAPRGLLCELKNGSLCTVRWQVELPHSAVPVHAIVSDTGNWVVMFDQWGNQGYENAVVVLDSLGAVANRYELEDFITEEEILRVRTSASSRIWSGYYYWHTFSDDETELVLQVQMHELKVPTVPPSPPKPPNWYNPDVLGPLRFFERRLLLPSYQGLRKGPAKPLVDGEERE
jgi:hypothetical protein